MAVRAYIAPLMGDGLSPDTAYRLSVADLAGPRSKFYIPSNADGTPKFTWGFAIVSTDLATLTNIEALPNVTRLPLFLPSTLLGDIPQTTRQAAVNKATSLGIDLSGLTLQNTYRDFLLRVARFLEPGFKTNEADDLDGQ